MDESSVNQNRRSQRSHVLMTASIEIDGTQIPVRLRNLSSEGALVEGKLSLPLDSKVLFRKDELVLRGRLVWLSGNRAGIAFAEALNQEAVMRHIPQRRRPPMPDFRRPPLRGVKLSPGEERIAKDWIFGEPLPSAED